MRIIFMGTPDFAVPSLQILLENDWNVVAVVTATDKMGGRGGKQLIESPVKKFALERAIPVLQPDSLKSAAFLEQLAAYRADLQIVVAFRMLPEAVWAMPRLGTFNLHGSLLPKYRGAAPINWAVINGERETGATTFFIRHQIDTGDVIFQEKMPIGEDETAGDVHDRMMHLGAGLVLKTVLAIQQGQVVLKRQDESLVCSAPKIFHETCRIDFAQTTEKVHDFIRGLSPYPGAWTLVSGHPILENGAAWEQAAWEKLTGEELKIFQTKKIMAEHLHPPGQLVTDGRKKLYIACQGGFVSLIEMQLRGRKRLKAVDFLNGLRS